MSEKPQRIGGVRGISFHVVEIFFADFLRWNHFGDIGGESENEREKIFGDADHVGNCLMKKGREGICLVRCHQLRETGAGQRERETTRRERSKRGGEGNIQVGENVYEKERRFSEDVEQIGKLRFPNIHNAGVFGRNVLRNRR